jgi:hypothetical protein
MKTPFSRLNYLKPSLLPALAFLLSLLSGYASANPTQRMELPESIGNDGLVVADVQGLGRLTRFSSNAEVVIKGESKSWLYGHYLLQPLPPGQYTIEAFKQSVGGYGPSVVPGVNVMIGTLTSLPVKINFTVRPGEVTNLGQLLLIPDERDPEKKLFAVRAVDNSADMRYYLQTFYPKLNASLGKDTLSPGAYIQGQDLRRLQHYIALDLGGSMASHVRYVAGPAGTVAALDRDAEGSVTKVRLLDSPAMTAAQAKSEQPAYDRFGFIGDDGRLFLVSAGQVEVRSPPISDPNGVFLFRDRGVVVRDDKFNLYTSNDNGRSWQHYAGAALPSVDATRPVSGGLAEDQDGYYVYRSRSPLLLHAKYGSTEYQPVTLPNEIDNVSEVNARTSGLFVETNVRAWTTSTPNPFFVRHSESGEWEKRHKPQAMCKKLEFLDDSGQRLRVHCNGEAYDSADGGSSWRR